MREYRKWREPQVTVVFRFKEGDRWKTIKKKGPKPDPASGRYYLRYTDKGGRQQRQPLTAEVTDYDLAAQEAAKLASLLLAQFRGVEMPEDQKPENKTLIADVVAKYLKDKSALAPRTVESYTNILEGKEGSFIKSLPAGVQYIQDVDAKVLRNYQDVLLAEGYAAKTVLDRLTVVAQLLSEAGSPTKVNWDNAPDEEEDPPRAYSNEELHKLFSVFDAEETAIFKFFLGTGCREKEVSHAEWSDIDWQRHTHSVRKKDRWKFTPKNHESRTIPIPEELVKLLKEYRKTTDPKCTLIFPNSQCRPNGHFLRYLKSAAKRAGLNCCNCVSEIAGKTHTCESGPYCEQFKLHNFRKTFATNLHHRGVALNDLKRWLGHKDLKTTEKYLAGSETHAPHVRAAVDSAYSF